MTGTYGATPGRGANTYARVGVESGVMSASPHQLIVMLFDGARTAIRAARIHMEAGHIAEKGASITKALNIVNNGLLAALDDERGGEVAGNLASLYEYIARRLLEANLRNDVDALNEAENLLEEIASAWREIEPQAAEA